MPNYVSWFMVVADNRPRRATRWRTKVSGEKEGSVEGCAGWE